MIEEESIKKIFPLLMSLEIIRLDNYWYFIDIAFEGHPAEALEGLTICCTPTGIAGRFCKHAVINQLAKVTISIAAIPGDEQWVSLNKLGSLWQMK